MRAKSVGLIGGGILVAGSTIWLTAKYYHWSHERARRHAEEARRRAEEASETERRARNIQLKSTLIAGAIITAFSCYGIYRVSQILGLMFGSQSRGGVHTAPRSTRIPRDNKINYVQQG
eukprot:gb/GECG01003120.1/.p1 GENE.gb/GECG01003120.1/~~gb/GECG01003120.1/.p1  ORF type:complete len:119 (+),score=10.28 gb/GECG01003120.1/:1-357(+)